MLTTHSRKTHSRKLLCLWWIYRWSLMCRFCNQRKFKGLIKDSIVLLRSSVVTSAPHLGRLGLDLLRTEPKGGTTKERRETSVFNFLLNIFSRLSPFARGLLNNNKGRLERRKINCLTIDERFVCCHLSFANFTPLNKSERHFIQKLNQRPIVLRFVPDFFRQTLCLMVLIWRTTSLEREQRSSNKEHCLMIRAQSLQKKLIVLFVIVLAHFSRWLPLAGCEKVSMHVERTMKWSLWGNDTTKINISTASDYSQLISIRGQRL